MWREAIQQVLIPAADLQRRIAVLGQAIRRDYQGKELIFVAILRGAIMFAADLARAIDLGLAFDCMVVSSYGDGQLSSGQVHILKDITENIAGKHVLIVEDIVDTGLTLQYLCKHLACRRPADLNICALLDKPARRQVALPIRYVGFEVPDVFVVGYGLDYQQRYRNLPFVGVLHPGSMTPE